MTIVAIQIIKLAIGFSISRRNW